MPTLAEQLEELKETVERCHSLIPTLEKLATAFTECLSQGNKVLSCGNGGSATDALHLTEELVGRYRSDRMALPSICLSSDVATMTCIANDWNYDQVFSRQIEAHGKKGDFLVCFTTSGNSANILQAMEKARSLGLNTVALMGKGGGKAKGLADWECIIPSDNTARIQEMHTWILHILLEAVEERFSQS